MKIASVYEEVTKHPPKTMFFGGISYKWMTSLVKCPKTVNSTTYCNQVLPRSRIISGMNKEYGKNNWLLMQDGAGPHIATDTMSYLRNKCTLLQDWPSNSPDLNPIENLWSIMGKQVNKRRPKTKKSLWRIVSEVWNNLDWKMIENLIDSMEKRLNLVMLLDGGCINGYF